MLIGSYAPVNGSILSKIITRSCQSLILAVEYKFDKVTSDAFGMGNYPFFNSDARLRLDLVIICLFTFKIL